jgi:hypothetical protein
MAKVRRRSVIPRTRTSPPAAAPSSTENPELEQAQSAQVHRGQARLDGCDGGGQRRDRRVRRQASGVRRPASGIRRPASATRKLFLGAVGNSSTTPTKWKLAVVGVPCLPRGSPVNRLSCSEAPAVAGRDAVHILEIGPDIGEAVLHRLDVGDRRAPPGTAGHRRSGAGRQGHRAWPAETAGGRLELSRPISRSSRCCYRSGRTEPKERPSTPEVSRSSGRRFPDGVRTTGLRLRLPRVPESVVFGS